MSKLLINENPLVLLPSLAIAFGVPEAIFLQQLHYWLATSKIIVDGQKWAYNTIKEWQLQLPFYSTKTIERAITQLRELGVVKTRALSGNKSNRTNYYSIDYAKLEEAAQQNTNAQKLKQESLSGEDIDKMSLSMLKQKSNDKTSKSFRQNDSIHSDKTTASIQTKCRNGYTETTKDYTKITSENVPQENHQKISFTEMGLKCIPDAWMSTVVQQHPNLPMDRIILEFIDFESFWGGDSMKSRTYTRGDWQRKFLSSVAKNLMSRPVRSIGVQQSLITQSASHEVAPSKPSVDLSNGEKYMLKDAQRIVSIDFNEKFVRENLIEGYGFDGTLRSLFMKAKSNLDDFRREYGLVSGVRVAVA